MNKDWKAATQGTVKVVGELGKSLPEVVEGFAKMNRAAAAEGVLSAKTKELIALAISVATRCDACIALHTRAAVKMGITREEFLEMLGVAIYMGGGPSYTYSAQALEAYDQLSAAQAPS